MTPTRHSPRAAALAVALSFSFCGIAAQASFAASRKDKIALDDRPESVKERSDYTSCRRKVLMRAKKHPNLKDSATKAGLAQCKDEYPAASFLVDCKKAALEKFARDAERLQTGLNTCKTRFERLNFDPDALVPFYVAGSKAYFAGAGMNVPRKLNLSNTKAEAEDGEELQSVNDFGNFSCDVAVNMMRDKQPEEYVLFGNHPRDFEGMDAITDDALRKKLNLAKRAKSGDDYVDYKDEMRVYGDLRDESLSVYFPLTYCHFNRKLGNNFQSVKVYYLADKAKQLLMPYFGISFYRKGKKVEPKKVIADIIDAMGDGYKVVNSRKGVTFIGKSPIEEFDDEGDPKNMCKQPRSNDFVAILKTDEAEKQADYLILSNVTNLCKYGDRIVSRIFAKGS